MKLSPKVLVPALIALGVLFTSCSIQAFAQSHLYVSTTGSDSSGNGSLAHPWATIAHASSKATPGTIVHVAAGVYTGSFTTSTSGTSSAPITYTTDTANFSNFVNCAQVAANHGNLATCVRLVGSSGTTWVNTGNYVVIKGFDVSGPGLNGIYTSGNATTIMDNHVHNVLTSTCNSNGGSGINLNGTNAAVIGNYVHNIGPYPSTCAYVQGIYFLQAGGYAWNNIAFANSGFGIQLWHEPAHIALVNNTIFNNASGGIVLGTDDTNFTVDYITVTNNIVYGNGTYGIGEEGATGIHNVYTHNLVDNNADGSYSLQNGLNALSSVNSNPDFMSYTGTTSGNYQVQSSSPAMNAGTSSGAPSYDFNNVKRTSGNVTDGAYQQ